jgi:hypothetical protein
MDVAAKPKELQKYSNRAEEPHQRLLLGANVLAIIYAKFVNSSHERARTIAPPTDALIKFLETVIALDRWVGDVGLWFLEADDPMNLNYVKNAKEFQELAKRVWDPIGRTIDGVTSYPGWNPLYATHAGEYDVAGYGPVCSGDSSAKTSIVGPDGKTYPVVVPLPPKSGGSTADLRANSDITTGAPDDGRVWKTTGTTLIVTSDDPGALDKTVGAIAAGSGLLPSGDAPVSAGQQQQMLVVGPGGVPTLANGTVSKKVQLNPSLAADIRPGRAENGVEGLAYAAEMMVAGASGWAAMANKGTTTVYSEFQDDGQGHRRVVVREYFVDADPDGKVSVSVAFWDGTKWTTPTKTPARTAAKTPVKTPAKASTN